MLEGPPRGSQHEFSTENRNPVFISPLKCLVKHTHGVFLSLFHIMTHRNNY